MALEHLVDYNLVRSAQDLTIDDWKPVVGSIASTWRVRTDLYQMLRGMSTAERKLHLQQMEADFQKQPRPPYFDSNYSRLVAYLYAFDYVTLNRIYFAFNQVFPEQP